MFQPELVEHRARRLLRLDYRAVELASLSAAFEAAATAVRAEPQHSARVLSLLPPHFTSASADAWKALGRENAPYVRASAVVASGFWKVVVTSLKLHGRGDLEVFDRELDALDWLAGR